MSQSGQQHPKADVGGQRPDGKKDGGQARSAEGVQATVDAAKKTPAKTDAKK